MDTPSVSPQRVTQLLADWSHGDDAALAELTPLVYEELRRLAHHYMERTASRAHTANDGAGQRGLSAPGRPNQPELAEPRHTSSPSPRERCAKSWSIMPRSHQSQKRGGGALKVELDEAALVSPEQSKEIVDLHEALERLATLDSRKAQVVELKYFGGLNYDEIAEVLKISTVTVRRDWVFAKAWLYTELHNAA